MSGDNVGDGAGDGVKAGEGSSQSFGGCCADLYQLPITHFLLGESFHPGGVELTRQLANQCLIGRESKVLDLACGRGATSLFLAQEYACSVSAVDLGQENLAVLEQAASDQGLGARIGTVQSSVDHLPFPEDTFDAVILRMRPLHLQQSGSCSPGDLASHEANRPDRTFRYLPESTAPGPTDGHLVPHDVPGWSQEHG